MNPKEQAEALEVLEEQLFERASHDIIHEVTHTYLKADTLSGPGALHGLGIALAVIAHVHFKSLDMFLEELPQLIREADKTFLPPKE